MQFVIHGHDKADGSAHRAPLRHAHLDYLNQHRNCIVARGPLFDDDATHIIGSLLILDVADKAEAEAFWAADPYNRAGVYDSTTTERWRFGHV
jgi:uncharacterized protein YciI